MACEAGEADLAPALLKVGGWIDGPDGPRVSQDGILLHGTNEEWARACVETQPILAAHFGSDVAAVTALLEAEMQECTVRDAAPLGPVEDVLRQLRDAGIALAVVTNDSEALAKAQLDKLGWSSFFGTIIGADSGHGAKPAPAGVRFAMEAAGVPHTETVMVGDSEADMVAGRDAGCAFTIAIHADGVVLPVGLTTAACRMPSIAELPTVLAGVGHAALRAALNPTAGGAAEPASQPAATCATGVVVGEDEVDPEVIALVNGMA